MTIIQSAHDPDAARPPILLFAAGAGLAAAALYYSQPILGALAVDMQVDERTIGWAPTLTQLGYACGILFLAPLGDRFDRRRIILIKTAALVASLLAAGFAPSIGALLAACLFIGLSATLAQDVVPAAAALAGAAERGRVVGAVMTGLLLGILLSRAVGGAVAEYFGWRAVFIVAAVAVALLGVAFGRGLPGFAPTTHLGYGALLRSLVGLWTRFPALRRAVWAQGLLSLAFSAFWSTLAVLLHGAPFHLGPAAAGAFGLAGAAGALAAGAAGRIADRRGPEPVTRLGAALTLASFAAMAFLPFTPVDARLWLLAATAVSFDLGVQASLIAHQTIVYGLEPAARSRLNAVLLTGMFIGMAAGAALGSQAFAAWGWSGVVGVAAAASAGALILRLIGGERRV